MKTLAFNFGNDQISVMRNVVKMSRRIRWSENEFSHRLSLEPTPVGAVSSAFAVGIANPAWLSSWSLSRLTLRTERTLTVTLIGE